MLKNLEIKDCLKILGQNHIGRLGYIFGQLPYVVPITYYHDTKAKCIISYSSNGHKLQAMRLYDRITLQVDEIKSHQEWQSVMVQGRFEELTGSDAKLYLHRFADGVRDVMQKKEEKVPRFIKDFSNAQENRGVPVVYRLIINDIVGKTKEA